MQNRRILLIIVLAIFCESVVFRFPSSEQVDVIGGAAATQKRAGLRRGLRARRLSYYACLNL